MTLSLSKSLSFALISSVNIEKTSKNSFIQTLYDIFCYFFSSNLESESDIFPQNGHDFSQKWKMTNLISPLQLPHSAVISVLAIG